MGDLERHDGKKQAHDREAEVASVVSVLTHGGILMGKHLHTKKEKLS